MGEAGDQLRESAPRVSRASTSTTVPFGHDVVGPVEVLKEPAQAQLPVRVLHVATQKGKVPRAC